MFFNKISVFGAQVITLRRRQKFCARDELGARSASFSLVGLGYLESIKRTFLVFHIFKTSLKLNPKNSLCHR